MSTCHQREHRLPPSVWNPPFVFSYWFLLLCEMSWRTWSDKRRGICTIASTRDLVSDSLCVCVYVCVCFNECACHAIHCQDFDRFLFVHKLLSVISSIFETIKQRRENGWLGNPWILICQQNESESGRWWKCAEWEVAADMSKEQTSSSSSSFGHFRSRLFSSAACPGARNGMRLTARGLKLQRIWMEASVR